MTKMTPRERFDRWLLHWDLIQLMRKDQDLCEIPSGEDYIPGPYEHPFHPLPTRAGEIRILCSSLCAHIHATEFIAVIEMDDEMVTVVPFSPYIDAASPYETILKHSKEEHLQVLQIWNLRRVPIKTLTKTWVIGELHQEDVNIARSVAKASITGKDPDPEIRAYCGTPIHHPQDPRRKYLEEQASRMDLIQAEGWTLFNK